MKSLAQVTCDADAREFFRKVHLGYAFSAQPFLPFLHGTITRGHGHGTKVDASTALITEFLTDVERGIHAAILASADKADGLFRAGPDATTT